MERLIIIKGQPFILDTPWEKEKWKKTSNGSRLNSSCLLKITICQPPLSLIHLIMVNGDLDLWQECVSQFVGLPKNCPSLRYQSRAVPHKSLHLQHIITKESPNILFYTTAGKRDHKTHHGVIWLTNCSSMFGLRVIFNSTFVCSRAVWYGTKIRHKS